MWSFLLEIWISTLTPHTPTNIYICGVTTAPRVRGGYSSLKLPMIYICHYFFRNYLVRALNNLFGCSEFWVISLSFLFSSSKSCGSHGRALVWMSFGSPFSWLNDSKKWVWVMESENSILLFSKLKTGHSVAST